MTKDDVTWRFESPDELTASAQLTVVVGFSGKLYMEPLFSRDNDSVLTLDAVSVIGSGLSTGGQGVNDNKRGMYLTVTANQEGSFLIVFQFTMTAGGIRLRRGILNVASLTGT